MQEVYERIAAGDAAARQRFASLMPVINAVQIDVNPIPVKALTAELGFGNYELRLPLLPLEEGARQAIVDAFNEFRKGVRV